MTWKKVRTQNGGAPGFDPGKDPPRQMVRRIPDRLVVFPESTGWFARGRRAVRATHLRELDNLYPFRVPEVKEKCFVELNRHFISMR
jgi:hypothetical protein